MNARNAWKAIAAIVAAHIALFLVMLVAQILLPQFYHFRTGAMGFLVLYILSSAIILASAAFFSKCRTRGQIMEAWGFHVAPPRECGRSLFYGLIMGIAIQFLVTRQAADAEGIQGHVGFLPAAINLLLTLAAPFLEETAYRGYFYKAFRKNYGVAVAAILVVAMNAMSHVPNITGSLFAGIGIIAMNIGACLYREFKGCVWYCIALHLGYNCGIVLFAFVHSLRGT